VHELAISSAVLESVLRHADGRRVTSVQLRVGHLRQVVPDSLEFYWDIVTRDGLCEGSVLELVAGADVEIAAGDELEVESIEVEEEPACTA